MDWAKTAARREEKRLFGDYVRFIGIGCVLYKRIDGALQTTSYESLSHLDVVGWGVAPVYPGYWGLAFRRLYEDRHVVETFL